MVGSQIVSEARLRGHQVVAITRNGTEVAGAESVSADISDLQTFRKVANESDVVVVSIPPARDGGDHKPLLDAHKKISKTTIPARVFVVGGAGALRVGDSLLKDAPSFPVAFKAEAETMTKIFQEYSAPNDLDWTMLAPAPVIRPGERTGAYVVGSDAPVGDSISSQDFAVAVLDEIENPRHMKKRFAVAN